MTSSVSLVILLVLFSAALAWFFARPGHARWRNPRQIVSDEDVDQEILEDAEAEIGELDASTTPEEADQELPDWGPGAPKS
ncbi:MAG: hypothetical protein GTN62_13725 [Gemmatimonadales bacterium]|nr:hypothetical protein [Gemmatimonadales bacterium]NIN13062.1 hypothetical protein [Gemmatimonadales bacterium]NIN51146.1 hypothetical protein [Gemmatimonadales bacterium]NIP08610.1 hypothetical protein [Gemmatimonadales bacterium]NIR02298.1 hypothetical protein [Gemmatimonadales bacterium]